MRRDPFISINALRVIAVTALSFSLLAGCGKAQEVAEEKAAEAVLEAAIESEAGGDIDVSDGGQTITGTDEQGRDFSVTQGDKATLPADFPKDLLVPEGMTLETAMVVGDQMFVTGELDGSAKAIAEAVTAHMGASGWTSVANMQHAQQTMMAFEHGKRTVSYSMEEREGGTVTLAISHGIDTSASPEGVDD